MNGDSEDQPRVDERVLRLHQEARSDMAEVTFEPGPAVLAKVGEALLDIAEANQVPLESGCRMGMCGADPVRILAGGENLSAVRRAERNTLARLGLPEECRMACVARVQGPVAVSPVAAGSESTDEACEGEEKVSVLTEATRDITRVVVIGTGVAGVTAVEELRRAAPGVDITLVGAEQYDFYNRMAISRLISDEISVGSLALIPPDWAARRRVQYLPGVSVVAIDREMRRVTLDDGQAVPYDRLILATGARPWVPSIPGFGRGGSFVLRSIDDAMQIRHHVRQGSRPTVVIGGGLLGLEAAAHIAQLGLRVRVVDRGPWPLSRQLDETAGVLLWQMMQDLGIHILANAEVRQIVGVDRVEGVELVDGQILPADVCLVTTGIVPDVALAEAAGLATGRGVIVNDEMATSDPAIYAIGDVVEHQGHIYGLWSSCVDQARTVIPAMLGQAGHYVPVWPPARLKVPGIDVLSVGRSSSESGGIEIRLPDARGRRYRKLVVQGGRIAGGILVGFPEHFDALSDAVSACLDVTDVLVPLQRGDWSVLPGTAMANRSEIRTKYAAAVGRKGG